MTSPVEIFLGCAKDSDHDEELTRTAPVDVAVLGATTKRSVCACKAAMTSMIKEVLSTW